MQFVKITVQVIVHHPQAEEHTYGVFLVVQLQVAKLPMQLMYYGVQPEQEQSVLEILF